MITTPLFLRCDGYGYAERKLGSPPISLRIPQILVAPDSWRITVATVHKTLAWGCVLRGSATIRESSKPIPVAIKVISKPLARKFMYSPTLEVEAQRCVRPRGLGPLDHGVIPPWDATEDGINYYFISTFARFGNLYDHLQSSEMLGRRLSEDFLENWYKSLAFLYLGQAAVSLSKLHKSGLCHLDLDLCNIVVGDCVPILKQAEGAKAMPAKSSLMFAPLLHLIDLGSARRSARDKSNAGVCDPYVKCKLLLAAPELLKCLKTAADESRWLEESKGVEPYLIPTLPIDGQAADMWALGTLLLELLVLPIDALVRQANQSARSHRLLQSRLRFLPGEVMKVVKCITDVPCKSCVLCGVAEYIPKPLLFPYVRLLRLLLEIHPERRPPAAIISGMCEAAVFGSGPRRSEASPPERPASSKRDVELLRGFFVPPQRP